MGIVFKNNAKTTLSSAVNNSTTTIPVTEGSVFPAVNLSGAGTFFLLTLDDETNNEILKVTSCSGASGNIDLTVIRAQEGTTARAFSSGDKAELRFTSGTVDEIRSDNTVHTNIFTTSNNSTTAFTLSDEVANENDLVVFIDGVFQAHNTFSVSGTTLTLATAPASGRVVTVYSIKGSRSASNVALATMTGDNSDTTLTLPVEPINENSVQVFFDGVYQSKSNFSISGTTLTFSTAPPTGVAVEALVFTKLAINTSSILSDTDADTKVQVEESSDEDKIRFDTAGSERVIIDNSGNVGIGTDTPSQKLHVYNSTLQVGSKTGDTSIQQNTNAIRISAVPNSTTEWGGLQWYREFSDYIGAEIIASRAGTAEADTDLILKTSTSDAHATERMRITHDGNVGIGVTNPDQALQVKGGIETQATNSTNGWILYTYTDDTFRLNFNGAGSDELIFNSNGTLFIGGSSHFSGGSNADDSLIAINGGVTRKAIQFSDFDEAYVDTPLGIFEGTGTFQASNGPSGFGNFFHLVSRTVATSGSSANNYITQVATSITGTIHTRYSSNNGTSWSSWQQV